MIQSALLLVKLIEIVAVTLQQPSEGIQPERHRTGHRKGSARGYQSRPTKESMGSQDSLAHPGIVDTTCTFENSIRRWPSTPSPTEPRSQRPDRSNRHNQIGLTDEMLDDPNTWVALVKRYLETRYNEDIEVKQAYVTRRRLAAQLPPVSLDPKRWLLVISQATNSDPKFAPNDGQIKSLLQALTPLKRTTR